MKKEVLFIVLIFLVFLLLIVLFPFKEPLSFENYAEVKNIYVDVQTGLLFLQTDSGNISMSISPEQALSIDLGLNGKTLLRPNTHDVFVESLKSSKGNVVGVTIDFMKGGIYFATLYIENGKVILIDVRPSDGIAIAVRTKSTVYINPNLLREEQINLTKETVFF